ncbi:MAG: hypothetical protein M0006_05725 [Magnetospirillum sp.]|nr:hypothetical protein [Magnetospirillum sp.]
MVSERQWAEALAAALQAPLASRLGAGIHVTTEDLIRHTAAITGHGPDHQPVLGRLDHEFTTDMLVWDDQPHDEGTGWLPRVVVEVKFFAVSAHDALAFMAKAERHRQLYPYLRTALVMPGMAAIPPRLPLLADRFDLMLALPRLEWDDGLLAEVADALAAETEASRALERLLTEKGKGRLRMVRRGLDLR